MAHIWRWICSLLFVGQMYLMMLIMGLLWFPWALVSRKGAFHACHSYCRWVRWTARWMVGIKTEVRGTPPTGEVLIAAKHQSFLDIIMIFSEVPRGKFIMKRELMFAPVIGQYGLRLGCVPVNRGRRAEAIIRMKQAVASGQSDPGQLIIYPQGTRVAPWVKAPYKIGIGVLYEQLVQPCVPVACNVGLFWPRTGIYRKPGTAVVEFLDPIEPGNPVPDFMAELEARIETASDRLMQEAEVP